jgi:hypothetical protein
MNLKSYLLIIDASLIGQPPPSLSLSLLLQCFFFWLNVSSFSCEYISLVQEVKVRPFYFSAFLEYKNQRLEVGHS